MNDCTKRKLCPDHQCERPDERVPSYAWHACKVWRRVVLEKQRAGTLGHEVHHG